MNTHYKIVWAKYPFIRILFPFLIGIVASDYIYSYPLLFGQLALILFIALLLLHFRSKRFDQVPYWFGLVSFCFWTSFSIFWTSLRDERNLPQHFSPFQHNELITKTYYVEEKDRFWDCYSEVIAQIDSTGPHPTNGNILLRINKSFSYIPATRDVYQGIFTLIEADGPGAPYEFDWNLLLHRRNIHYLTYIDTSSFKIIHFAKSNWLERSRDALDHAIKTMIPSTRDYPVASAMLIGLRKKMDPELYRAYSATGAVHVLSVSGMHVGILASILELIFGLIKSQRKSLRIIKPLLVISLIWGYTFLTGATPSILRSALMFTCFILARNIQRDAAVMNILAGAAFILLMVNPLDIYNIGFQLSFGAMAGIFILYEPIRQLVTITNKYVQLIWKIMAVSFAAQLLIYPIVGYHFHQFAFYFWLTSLISSPFSFVILIGGMIALPIYFIHIPWLKIFYYPLIYSVKWMNDIISWIYTLPLGKVRGWWPNLLECVLLIVVSVMIGQYLLFKSYRNLRMVLITLIFFMIVMTIDEFREQQKTELIATNDRNNPKIWIKNKMSIIQLVGDSSLMYSNYAEKYNLTDDHLIRIDTSTIRYESDSLFVSSNQISNHGQVYHWITKRTDTLSVPSVQHLIFLPKYWKNKIENKFYPASLYTISSNNEAFIKNIFPQSQIIKSKHNYVQLSMQ